MRHILYFHCLSSEFPEMFCCIFVFKTRGRKDLAKSCHSSKKKIQPRTLFMNNPSYPSHRLSHRIRYHHFFGIPFHHSNGKPYCYSFGMPYQPSHSKTCRTLHHSTQMSAAKYAFTSSISQTFFAAKRAFTSSISQTFFAAIIALFLFVPSLHAQLLENFEEGTKSSYSPALETLPTGPWFLGYALIGREANDQKNGSKSVRLDNRSNQGFLQMNFDFSEGANELSFYAGKSKFSGDQSATATLLVQYSLTSGTSWVDVDEITVPGDLTLFNYVIEQPGNIRFRFLTTGGQRMNVDDVYIEPYAELSPDPALVVKLGNDVLEGNSTVLFPAASVGSEKVMELTIRNNGQSQLDITDLILIDEQEFSFDTGIIGSYESREERTLTLRFNPTTEGDFSDQLIFSTNDPNQQEFVLNIEGSSLSENSITPIAIARGLDFGTRVTVAGRVSVANEFEGPVFIQDKTAGIAVYYPELHTAVERGDSVIVTGPVTEFNPTTAGPGGFLIQIAEHEGDDDISFTVVDVPPVPVTPVSVTVQGMNEGAFESMLVQISDVTILHTGAFQGNTNYDISDQSGLGVIRIDNSTELVNATAPTGPTNIVGVVDVFFGTYQLKPRDLDDLSADPIVIIGEEIPKDLTFDVVTWNIEWFGDEGNGPVDNIRQMENALEVMRTIDADLYALQEISNLPLFNQLVDSLEGYSGFWANYASQSQNTAFVYRDDVIEHLNSGQLTTNQVGTDWANRFPLFFEFNASVNGVTRHIYAYNVHAKAFGDAESYQDRILASLRLKIYLDNFRIDDNVLFLGDYNDFLTTSTYENNSSPYENFVEDEHYFPISLSLEERGFASYISSLSPSMIDHMTVTNELIEDHIDGAERVENPSYIGSYISTTSDHAPVWTRFDFTRTLVSSEVLQEHPTTVSLSQNYPNPFNPKTTISFELNSPGDITLTVVDLTGRTVAVIARNQRYSAGAHSVSWNASDLSSGVYLYRIQTDAGESVTRKMTLIK